ncbi:SPOR domain-containing protein, partial [Treponema saccharophilum]|uniref:SPOR domain-containing protein n=1 Tax=Treponema saccharophilum TaxID=165 RepID=UPI003865540A
MRKALFLMAFLALSAFAASENWYICLASFMHEDKADALISALDGKGIPAVKSEFVKPTGEKFFRILFAQLFPNLTKAQLKRDNLRANPAVLELGLDGLWCCRVSDIGSLDNSNPPESERQVILVLINGVPYKRLEI